MLKCKNNSENCQFIAAWTDNAKSKCQTHVFDISSEHGEVFQKDQGLTKPVFHYMRLCLFKICD